jgi:elongation factor G
MTSMHVPDAGDLAVRSSRRTASPREHVEGAPALHQGRSDLPSRVDQESGETVISGMGELQLDVYIERMRREYGVKVQVSPPQVAYRETITQRADYNYTHKKQTGGSGQYGKISGYIEPNRRG